MKALIDWRGVFFDRRKDRGFVCVFSIFNAGGSVCGCMCLYTHAHTHSTDGVLGCEPRSRDETPGGPEESRLTKVQYTCILYRCTKYICLYIWWAAVRGLWVPDVDFLETLYSNSWMKIHVGSECTTPIQLDTGIVQGSVRSLLLFDLFLNALLRLLDATGTTHDTKRIPQWNHAAFANDLSIYVCTVRDANSSTWSTSSISGAVFVS